MRMIEVPVYKFDELDKKVQEKLIDLHSSDYTDMVNEDLGSTFQEKLIENGYLVTDIRWSISACQGDGVAFYGDISGYDAKTIIDRVMPFRDAVYVSWGDVTINIRKRGAYNSYNHWNTMVVDVDYSGSELPNDLEEALTKDVVAMSNELHKLGEEMLYPSREDIIAEIKELGYEYFSDGRLYT